MLSLENAKKHELLSKVLTSDFTKEGYNGSIWIWNYLFEGRSDVFFQMDETHMRINYTALGSNKKAYHSFMRLMQVVSTNSKIKEEIMKVFIDEFNINAAIIDIPEDEKEYIIDGVDNIIVYLSSLLNYDTKSQRLFFINKNNWLCDYRRNQEILRSLNCTGVSARDCLYFQNLGDVMIFSINGENNGAQIWDINTWKSQTFKSDLDVVSSCIDLYENDNIIVVEYARKNAEFKFFYKKIDGNKSHANFRQNLKDDKNYYGIMYNPIFYNTIHHSLLSGRHAPSCNVLEDICRNIREAMYGENVLIKKYV